MEYAEYLRKTLRSGDRVIYNGSDKLVREGTVVSVSGYNIDIREDSGRVIREEAHGVLRKIED